MFGIVEEEKTDYYRHEAVDSDDLLLMQQASPYHLWARKFAADTPRTASRVSEDRTLRMAIHSLLLEPDEFPYQYSVIPDGITSQSKAGREFFAEIEAEGRTPIKPDHYEQAHQAATAARANPAIRYLLSQGGVPSRSLYWQDDATGASCKARPYLMIEPCDTLPNGLILALHTCQSAADEAFQNAAVTYGYDRKADWESKGFQRLFGTASPPAYILAALEMHRPFGTNIWPVGADMLALADHHNRAQLSEYAAHIAADHWPCFHTDLSKPLTLPPRARKEYEEIFGKAE